MKILKKIIGNFKTKLNFTALNKYLLKDEKYYNIFNDDYSSMLIIFNEIGEIIDVNAAACEYYGYDKKKFLSMKISDIIALSSQEATKKMETAKNGTRKFFKSKHRLSSGEIREVEVYNGDIRVNDRYLLFSVVHDLGEKYIYKTKFGIEEMV